MKFWGIINVLPTSIFSFRSIAAWDTIHGFVRLHFLYIEESASRSRSYSLQRGGAHLRSAYFSCRFFFLYCSCTGSCALLLVRFICRASNLMFRGWTGGILYLFCAVTLRCIHACFVNSIGLVL